MLATFLISHSSFLISSAQTLNVTEGNVVYQFPASQAGDMTYSDGTTLTIMGKAFTLSDISSMTIDNTEVTDNSIGVAYDGLSALVTVAGIRYKTLCLLELLTRIIGMLMEIC